MYALFLFFLLFQFQVINLSFLNKPKVQRNLETKSDDIVILHLNDVHCGINDTIGYDGFLLYREEIKKQYNYVITVDVGDHIQGGTLGAISFGEAIIRIMNEINFDVAILGNHEFDYGVEKLIELGNNITNRYICANFRKKSTGIPLFDPYKIIEIGGKKIAFIGVLTPLTFSKTYLCSKKDQDGNPTYDFLSEELSTIIQTYINEVKTNGTNYVILLTHMGMDVEEYTSNELISHLEGVDAVLDGHTHKIYNTTTNDLNNNNIPISQTGTKLESIGKLILKKDGAITSEIIKEVPEPTDKTNAIKIKRSNVDRWVDKNLNIFINNIWDEFSDQLNLEIGETNFDFLIRPEGRTDSSSVFCRYKECTLGNLVTDAIRSAGNGEITITTGGTIRNNLNKGKITRGNIINILPWFNSVVSKKITGKDLLDALELGVSKLPKVSGGFPQVSGINFDIDISFESTVEIDNNGMFVKVNGKRRVSNVKINGEDIDVNRIYNASFDNFVASGGDGYSMLAKLETYNESLLADSDSLSYYISNNLGGQIPEKYKELQGRINIKGGAEESEAVERSKRSNWNSFLFLSYYYMSILLIFLF